MKRLLVMVPLIAACGDPENVTVKDLQSKAGCVVTAASCSAVGDGLAVQLQLPRNPEPLKPLVARVHVQGDTTDAPVLELSMVGMDMGENRYQLVPGEKGEWTATVVLPVCIRSRADWIADVILYTGQGRYRARFPFRTGG